MKYHLFLLLILFSNNLISQDNLEELDFLFPGDSIPSNTFMLDEVTVFQPLKFNNDEEIKRYVILRYRVKKVYPYAKLASERMIKIDARVDSIKSKRKKRVYLKKLEKFVYKEFSDELRKLSRSQGRILVKLLNRQTGLTAHKIVSEYRNKFRALLYNTAASFYSISLKDEYEPFVDFEDYLIEDILQRSFSDGSLKKQDYALDFDLDKIYEFWLDKNQ
ncbi:MAG: DUF4294 domain-containing protein [Candidatus Marisimplicoccus sp.]|tara:strand:- start:169 stop:825 length:657 start_codon:yes stop_codon:yes gene_type:complete